MQVSSEMEAMVWASASLRMKWGPKPKAACSFLRRTEHLSSSWGPSTLNPILSTDMGLWKSSELSHVQMKSSFIIKLQNWQEMVKYLSEGTLFLLHLWSRQKTEYLGDADFSSTHMNSGLRRLGHRGGTWSAFLQKWEELGKFQNKKLKSSHNLKNDRI